ncbi:MAG: phospholipid/glycerol acyltransferase [Bacteroidota bacterium]|nr:phospholipid/glycerol acyltransferase [Bacteroidota bacterium]
MNLFKRIFGFIWAVWGGFWFIMVVAVLTPIYAVVLGVFGKKYSMKCVWVNTHYASPFLLMMMGIRLKISGDENVDPASTYVYVANHASQVDILVTAASIPQPIRFLAKSEIKKIPLFGYMTKMLAIMVDRKNKESREKSVHYMIDELKKGNSIFLYPEGTRNRTPQPLKEFKDGAFRIAIMAQTPIIVQTLTGAKTVNDPKGIQLYPGVMGVHFSKPIETRGLTLAEVPVLVERAKNEMMGHLNI